MNFKQELKKVMILYPDVEISETTDYQHLVNIHNIFESLGYVEPHLVKKAFEARKSLPLRNQNDYFYLVFKSLDSESGIRKVAYPYMAESIEPEEFFDLSKWANLVYKIYDAVSSGDMSLENAIDYYANSLNKKNDEDKKFKTWIKYYQSGEHNKYSQEHFLKKDAYQFPLSSPGFYPSHTLPSDVLEESSFDKMKELATNENQSREEYLKWKDKLHAAIRRIDRLLRQSEDFIDTETQRDLADLLHHFDQDVRGLKHEKTSADLAYKLSKKFEKRGFHQGSEILAKYAQAVEPTTTPEAVKPNELPVAPTQELPEEKPSLEKIHEPTTDKPNSSVLSGDITLDDAVSKLEESAGLLANRSIVRSLAEFDIMLDRIGIASMFPELAEAQSKLIDAYSYALTRVSKMLGMLSSGKSLLEISDAKKKELTEKTMKEVGKSFEAGTEEKTSPERGAEAIQEGLKEVEPVTPTTSPAAPPKAPPVT